MEKTKRALLEVGSVDEANKYILDGEFRLEGFSNSRDAYILVRRKGK